jgi:hypothetical protein
MAPPLSPDEARRLEALERWRKDHDAEHARLREDMTLKVADMTNAAVRHVEKVVADSLKPVGEIDRRLGAIEAQNTAQTHILHQQNEVLATTRDELVANRIEREKRAAADLAKEQIEKKAKDDRDAALAAKSENTKRLALYVGIITALIAGVVALAAAAIGSHH